MQKENLNIPQNTKLNQKDIICCSVKTLPIHMYGYNFCLICGKTYYKKIRTKTTD